MADYDGITPLHWAAGYCLPNVARTLLQAGADANASDAYSYTPLHQASDAGCADVVEILIQAGAQVNYRSSDGMTALRIAEDKIVVPVGGHSPYDRVKEILRLHGGTL
jgi:ankyrin repeat protein